MALILVERGSPVLEFQLNECCLEAGQDLSLSRYNSRSCPCIQCQRELKGYTRPRVYW